MIIRNAIAGAPGGKKKKINIYERTIKVKSSPLPDSRVPCMVEPSSHEIKSLGFSRGELLMGASVVDTHIGRSEMLAVNLACGNASRVNITKVEVKLCETVYWRAINEDDISKYASKDMTKTKNLMVVPNLKLSGLVRKRSMSSDELDVSGGDEYERIYKDLMSGQSRFRLQIPKKSLDSYKGQCLKVTHHLKVKLWTPTLTDNPHIIIPLKIGFPPKRELRSSCINDNSDKKDILPDVPVIKNDENNGFDDSFINEPQQAVEEEKIIPVGADSIMLSRVKTTKADIFLGDNTVLDSSSSSAKPTPSSPTSSATRRQAPPPSLRVLLSKMKSSINDYEIIVEKLNSPVWHELLSTQVSPSEFGSIVKEVNVEFDQPRVAVLLVPVVNGGTFTCSYCASALSNCAKWIRPTMLTKLLPYCTDIETNHTTIRNQLNKWETIVTNRDFKDAIAKRKHG